jgi:hypothetical protein
VPSFEYQAGQGRDPIRRIAPSYSLTTHLSHMCVMHRWALTQASRSNADTHLMPEIRLEGVEDRTFSKKRRERSCPLPQSFSIIDEPNF